MPPDAAGEPLAVCSEILPAMHNPPPPRQDSLYFTYPDFAFVEPPELRGETCLHDVVIVGAGPVGLACALELARSGIRPVILEAKRTLSDGSRALSISRRSQEILDGLGVSEPFQAHAIAWTRGRSFYRDRVIFTLDMPHSDDERFGPMSNLQQCRLEQILVERVRADQCAEIRWQTRACRVLRNDENVTLEVACPGGSYRLQARYVIAADGARSTMREALDLRMEGTSYEGLYLIADIRIDSSLPAERHAWFDPPSNPGSTVLMHKQPDNLWRIDYQLLPDQDPNSELDPERIRARISQHLESIGENAAWELDWFSLYRAHCLCLDQYRHGRILFAGDAAHLVPIFGVRGLNSGIADANNLGWKLAAVLSGIPDDLLLDSYSQERRAATLDIFRHASKSTAFMTPPSSGHRLMRDAALSLALSQPWAGALANPRQSSPYDYINSPLNAASDDDTEFAAGPRTGAPLFNMRLSRGGFLLDHLKPETTLLHFGDAPVDLPISVLAIAQKPGAAAIPTVLDPDQRIAERYGATPGACYLVRPDGHVAGRWRRFERQAVLATASRWTFDARPPGEGPRDED